MTHGYDFVKNPVEFVRASKESSVEIDRKEVNFEKNDGLSGNEAKDFYENLLKSTTSKKLLQSTKRSKCKPSLKQTRIINAEVKPSTSNLKQFSSPYKSKRPAILPKVADFFKAAEEGQLHDVKQIVETRLIDIDATDQFCWTALMMASHQGHKEVVKYLLLQGADWENKVTVLIVFSISFKKFFIFSSE